MTRTDINTDQDVQIAQYVLGLLGPEENRVVQELLNNDSGAARRALRWEEAFLGLVDALPPATPPHSLLTQVLDTLDLPHPSESSSAPSTRPAGVAEITTTSAASDETIPLPESVMEASAGNTDDKAADVAASPTVAPEIIENPTAATPVRKPEPAMTVGLSTPPPSADRSPPRPKAGMPAPAPAGHRPQRKRSKKLWVSGAGIGVVLLAALAIVPRTPSDPPVVVVEVAPKQGAILQAPGQSSTPGWVVSIDPENNVSMTPKVYTEVPDDASVQLWTYNRAEPSPRSLGLVDPNQPVIVPAELMQQIGDDQFFEMTLEPGGGSPTSEPTGPILFIGRVVTFE